MKLEEVQLKSQIKANREDALIIVDIQNDFLPLGALGVKGGDEIVEPINALAERFHRRGYTVVMTQDWHPPGHYSFASTHGKKPFEPYEAAGIGPILWPDHCVQGSQGADFHPDVEARYATAIVRKGYHLTIDSYSTFLENDRKTPTGLSGYLKTLGKNRVFLCGLAFDYCVYYSAIDGRNLGFDVVVPINLSKAIDSPPGHFPHALDHMSEKGVQFIRSKDIIV